jgi:hypothetical protein
VRGHQRPLQPSQPIYRVLRHPNRLLSLLVDLQFGQVQNQVQVQLFPLAPRQPLCQQQHIQRFGLVLNHLYSQVLYRLIFPVHLLHFLPQNRPVNLLRPHPRGQLPFLLFIRVRCHP